MKKRKTLLSLVLVIAMMSMTLAGCGGSSAVTNEPAAGPADTESSAEDTASGEVAQPAAESEEIRVFTFFTGSDQWAPVWTEVVKEYMEANPGIKILDESAPTAGSNDLFRTKMQADLAAGTPADLSLFYVGADTKALADTDLFADIAPMMEEDTAWSGNFKDTAVKSQLYEGTQYSLPFLGYYEGMFYNMELFDKYGLEAPTTYDNMLKAVETFSANGVVSLATSLAKPSYLLETFIIAQTGEENHKNYFDESWQPALDCIADLYQKGAFPKDTMTISEDDIRLMFAEGKAAMMLNGSWCVADLESNPNMRLTAVPTLPGGKGGANSLISGFGSGWHITKEAAERSDNTLKFLKYLTSPEIMQRFVAVGGSAAVNCDVPEGASPLMQSAIEMLNKATYMDTAIDSQVAREAWMAIADDGIPYLVEGNVTSAELLEKALEIQNTISGQ